MQRRDFLALGATGALSATLCRPHLADAQALSKLTFIPVTDLTVLDPFFAGPDVTSLHAFNVYETLYAMDRSLVPQRQMVEGETVEDDGRRVTMTLREGLRFHDGAPVLASDVVASLRKWGSIDVLGAKLMSVTDSLTALSDRVVEFRLKRRFPLLKTALSKPGTFTAFIMPARLIPLSGTGKMTEIVGSGPYQYRADERVIGSRVVYTRFDAYVPRKEPGNWLAGGRIAHYPRVVWTVIPDAATAAATMQKGEADWWGDTPPDLAPLLRSDKRLQVQVQDLLGGDMVMRFNALYPPFDNPALRHAILPAIKQSEFMTAICGDDHSLWRDGVGAFSRGKPMSSDAGLDIMQGDFGRAREMVKAAGYQGEKIVVMVAADYPALYATAMVGVDLLKKLGFNVELLTLDYGSYTQRRASKAVPGQGGWNVFFNNFNGYSRLDPAAHLGISSAWAGWPKIDEIEALRDRWFEAEDLAAQREVARQIQLLVIRDAPFISLGTFYGLTSFDRRLTGIEHGTPPFFNVRPV